MSGEEKDTMETTEVEAQLILKNISKSFPGLKALSGVNLDVRKGEVHALLGENGAGKSTLSSIIAGLIQSDAGGEMTWKGQAYYPLTPKEAMENRIGLIHQELKLLPQLSIAENIFVGRIPVKSNGLIDRKYMESEAEKQLKRLGLEVDVKEKVGKLKVADQQMVEIAKAMTLNAQLLILDEPTAALGSKETEKLFELVMQLKKEGVSFIYISHRLEEIAQISDRITVLRDGQLIKTHDTAEVPIKKLVEEMVGRQIDTIFPEMHSISSDKVVLEVKNLTSYSNAFRDISFTVKEGEVFGIAGIVGAGRSEVIRAIAGADPKASGEVLLDGEALRIQHPKDAIQAGIIMVPEDRKLQGLILNQSITDNLALCNFDMLSKKGWVHPNRLEKFSKKMIKEYGVKGEPHSNVKKLSGGNQQKVLIAKWVSREPKVIILDEPTRGVDVGARNSIYNIIKDFAAKGISVIVVSSELEEVIGLSHRVMVLSRGNQKGILDNTGVEKDANNVAVIELATT
jgi:ribose transport system ATP-binding protein